MTLRRWCETLLGFLVSLGFLVWARHHVRNAWGMVILGLVCLMGFGLLVNTVDLLCGRWIRGTPPPPRYPPAVPQTRIVRRIICEEVRDD